MSAAATSGQADGPETTRLAAVVVTWNRLDQIRQTLARLLEQPCDRVVVVDNGSTDGTREWLQAQDDPRIDPLLPARNLGGAGGFELGLRHVVESCDPDWIVLMDDDARPEPGALAAFRAYDAAGAYDGVAAVASAVRYPDGRVCEMNRPARDPFASWRRLLRVISGRGRMGFHLPDSAYEGMPVSVDVASFVGLFLSRRAIRKAGFPDGDLFIYGDDSLYTLRLSRMGLELRFDPAIRFEHDCSALAPAGQRARVYRPLWKVYYNYRNGLILYRETAGALFWAVLPVVLVKWVLNGRHYGADRREYYRLLARAVADGIRGRVARIEQDAGL